MESLIPRYSSYLACSVVSEPEKQVLLAGVREKRRPASGFLEESGMPFVYFA